MVSVSVSVRLECECECECDCAWIDKRGHCHLLSHVYVCGGWLGPLLGSYVYVCVCVYVYVCVYV